MKKQFKKQTVLITGAAGFIGSHLTRRLVDLGADVHVFLRQDRNPWRIEDVIPKLRVWNTDITDSPEVRRCVEQIRPRRVFHLAASVNPERSLQLLDEMIEVNIQGTANLCKALEGLELDCFVNTGTCEEYGDNDAPFDENLREKAVSPYSASKIAATHFCQMAHKITDIPVVTVRPFLTYGPYQVSNRLIPALIRSCLNNEPEFRMTSGEQTREFNYVSDIVDGILQASLCKDLAGDIVNIGNATEYKISDVARMIVKLMDSPIKLECGALNHRKGEVMHFYSSAEKYRRLLQPPASTPLEEGLKKTIAWFRSGYDENKIQRTYSLPQSKQAGERIRNKIYRLVEEYYTLQHKPKEFIPGTSPVKYAGRAFDEKEMQAATRAVLDFWLTYGDESLAFERKLADFLGRKHVILVNSGSSANLLAISALTAHDYKNRLSPGDEIITPAMTFPTTLAPIVQNGLIPVFLDTHVGTYTMDINLIEKAVSEKTKAVFIPHTLGNVADMDDLQALCEKYGLILIEDTCDALGSLYKGKQAGSFGLISTFSFYPAHHITLGEGGAVATDDNRLKKIITSLRDWGRDCWCNHLSPANGECNKRFEQQWGDLPKGYDHKYTYSHLGYNLKALDIQAAIGREQLKKLPSFTEARKRNFKRLYEALAAWSEYLILPTAGKNTEPSWFSFIITVKPNKKFSRETLLAHLNENKIETRMLFAGNALKQPGFKNIKHRVYGSLANTDFIMDNTFFIGVHPNVTTEMIDFTTATFKKFFDRL